MAKSRIPSPMERRHLIEKAMDPSQARALAQHYLDAGRVEDAIVFLAKADAQEELAAIARRAVEEGDAFLLRAVEDVLDEGPSVERWMELATTADELGKHSYGEMARRHARSLGE